MFRHVNIKMDHHTIQHTHITPCTRPLHPTTPPPITHPQNALAVLRRASHARLQLLQSQTGGGAGAGAAAATADVDELSSLLAPGPPTVAEGVAALAAELSEGKCVVYVWWILWCVWCFGESWGNGCVSIIRTGGAVCPALRLDRARRMHPDRHIRLNAPPTTQ